MSAPKRPATPADPALIADDPTVRALAQYLGRRRAEREAIRLRAILVRVADAIDIALDSDWRVAIDIMLDLSDEIHAELVP